MAKIKRSAKEQAQLDQSVDDLFMLNVDNIVPVDLEDEMKSAFIDYAMSVITDRALPDVRDGLKPVHRRILYSMYTQGFTPDKSYRKCAATVGDVLGRFHPHGDAAVYDALVRLGQDFSQRHTLVDGHGNFGSRDGDPPAAYRYTEARLTRISMELIRDINKNTVDFQPNFDDHEMEPMVLPAGFPNLLVNGSTGIAVGMATNIPSHNLSEVIDGTIYLMRNPEASLEDLMQIVKAPDFSTGGVIMGLSGVREAYSTGRGRIVVRARCEIEEFGSNRYRIIVNDLPFAVNKARLIEKIADLAKEKRIEGISFIRDESDRNEAVRICIELRASANPNVVLNQLYKHTQLQDNFNANMLALVPDDRGVLEPKMVNLIDALSHYIAHQKEVTIRRTRFELEKAEARRHIVEGLLKAIDRIDEVIRIIRSSSNEDEAKTSLSERFGFSDRQSQHIVDMRLGRLTGLERDKLLAEFEELSERIDYFKTILLDEKVLIDTIEADMLQVRNRFANERQTDIDPFAEEITDESLIKEEQVMVTLTHFGYVKRQAISTYQSQHRGGRGISGMTTREEDYVEILKATSTHDLLLFFTDTGRVFKMKAYQIPESSRAARGMAIVNLLALEPDEKIQTVIPIRDPEEGGYLSFVTRNGQVKRTELQQFKNINKSGLIAINLRDDDKLVNVLRTDQEAEILIATANGMSIRFHESDARPMGRDTSGVRGINLREGDRVVGALKVDDTQHMFVVSAKGFGKRTRFEDYRLQNRGGYGIMTYKVTEKTGAVVGVATVDDSEDLILVNDVGVIIRLNATEVPVQGRAARGVTLMRSQNSEVVDLAVVDHEEEELDHGAGDADALDGAAVSDELGTESEPLRSRTLADGQLYDENDLDDDTLDAAVEPLTNAPDDEIVPDPMIDEDQESEQDD